MNARPLVVGALLVLVAACGNEGNANKIRVPGQPGAQKTVAAVRAERRLYDGAPPVIPHQDFGAACLSCHERGMSVPGVGYAPTVPHDNVQIPGLMSRCRQCHVFAVASDQFRENDYRGLPQDLRKGDRLYDGAPPVIPHPLLLRENCKACHTGPAAREEIRCSHPERDRCRQCHVPAMVSEEFHR